MTEAVSASRWTRGTCATHHSRAHRFGREGIVTDRSFRGFPSGALGIDAVCRDGARRGSRARASAFSRRKAQAAAHRRGGSEVEGPACRQLRPTGRGECSQRRMPSEIALRIPRLAHRRNGTRRDGSKLRAAMSRPSSANDRKSSRLTVVLRSRRATWWMLISASSTPERKRASTFGVSRPRRPPVGGSGSPTRPGLRSRQSVLFC